MSVTEVHSRIAQIQSQLALLAPAGTASSAAAFASSLAAQRTSAAGPLTGAGVPATSGTGPAAAGGVSGEAVVAEAKKYLGVPYLWGGTDPKKGLDCSGLIQLLYRGRGVTVPRDADAQAAAGRPVARSALRPGDVLLYGVSRVHHAALYVGGGRMLEAPDSSSRVRIVPLRTADYAGARRFTG